MSTIKTYGAIAIMIGCFAVIYPRFMHPIVLSVFGMREPPRQQTNDQGQAQMFPPGHQGHQDKPHGGPEDMRRHMRHGPHPGMRAAAEMQRQQSQHGGGGRGMMGVVLPMYAVGIVLYLGYTLYKVFNKTNAKDKKGRYSWDKTGRYGNRGRDRMGFPKDFDGNEDIKNFLHDQEHRQNLEDLLTRVDDKNVSVDEMKVLQQRLEETEAQMTRILQAMRGIHQNVDNLSQGQGEEAASPDSGPKDDREETLPSQKTGGEEKVDGATAEKDGDATSEKDTDATQQADMESADVKEKNGVEKLENDDHAVEDVTSMEDKVVDEAIEGKQDDEGKDGCDANSSNVRQRNVKVNEQ